MQGSLAQAGRFLEDFPWDIPYYDVFAMKYDVTVSYLRGQQPSGGGYWMKYCRMKSNEKEIGQTAKPGSQVFYLRLKPRVENIRYNQYPSYVHLHIIEQNEQG